MLKGVVVYSLLLKISVFYRWLILFFVWALFIILWYVFLFKHFKELINLSQIKIENAVSVVEKLKSTTAPEILNACKTEEKDINFLNSLIINLIQESKVSLSKCTVACQNGICEPCLNFCVYGDFDNIKNFFDSVDALNIFNFCYFNLKMSMDLNIAADFAVKASHGIFISSNKNNTCDIESERNPFEKKFNIECLGLVTMGGNNFLLAKFENKIIKLAPLDAVGGYRLILLDSKAAVFEDVVTLKAIKKFICE